MLDHCIFCHRPFGPDRPRTAEHVAPRWARKLLVDRGKAQHLFVVETADGSRIENRGWINPFTTVAEDVCRQCNTGWMAEMERACRSFAGDFIRDVGRQMHYWNQAQIAAWAVKTGIVWDHVSPDDRTIPWQAAELFHRIQRPLGQHQVWLGRYSGEDPYSFRRAAAHVVDAVEPDPQRAHAYLLTFTLGQLAAVVYGQHIQPPTNHQLPLVHASKLIQVWQLRDEVVSWPPDDSLDDAALEECARSLGLPIRRNERSDSANP